MELLIALAPVGVYILIVGLRNVSRRGVVVSGFYDRWLVAVAVIGMVAVGPFKLVFPVRAFAFWEPIVGATILWAVFAVLWMMLVSLVVRRMRRSIVVYNISRTDLFTMLNEATRRLDADAARVGSCVLLPQRGVELCIDFTPWSRCATLVATSTPQNESAWRALEKSLREVIATGPVGAGFTHPAHATNVAQEL